MSKTNIVDIKKIAFTKLRKHEVYGLFNDVLAIVGRYDTKAMHIGDTCAVLMALQPKNELLRLTERDFGPHLLTPQIDKLHEKRLKFASTITQQMRVVEKAALAHKQHLVNLAKPIVYGYLNYLRKKDKASIESDIATFFYELELRPEVRDALYELGFETYLYELAAANSGYIDTYAERTSQLSKRPKGSTTPVQRELQYVLKILFEQVDYYQHVFRDVDYSGLNTAFNHAIAVYTKQIKTRDTQRKNKKLKALEEEQTALDEKFRMDKIEQRQTGLDAHTSAIEASIEAKKGLKEKLTKAGKKKKEKGKTINGLLDILKKPDPKNGDKDDLEDDADG